jgi:hypothetical protein
MLRTWWLNSQSCSFNASCRSGGDCINSGLDVRASRLDTGRAMSIMRPNSCKYGSFSARTNVSIAASAPVLRCSDSGGGNSWKIASARMTKSLAFGTRISSRRIDSVSLVVTVITIILLGNPAYNKKRPFRASFCSFSTIRLVAHAHATHVWTDTWFLLGNLHDQRTHRHGGTSNGDGVGDCFLRHLGWIDDASLLQVD